MTLHILCDLFQMWCIDCFLLFLLWYIVVFINIDNEIGAMEIFLIFVLIAIFPSMPIFIVFFFSSLILVIPGIEIEVPITFLFLLGRRFQVQVTMWVALRLFKFFKRFLNPFCFYVFKEFFLLCLEGIWFLYCCVQFLGTYIDQTRRSRHTRLHCFLGFFLGVLIQFHCLYGSWRRCWATSCRLFFVRIQIDYLGVHFSAVLDHGNTHTFHMQQVVQIGTRQAKPGTATVCAPWQWANSIFSGHWHAAWGEVRFSCQQIQIQEILVVVLLIYHRVKVREVVTWNVIALRFDFNLDLRVGVAISFSSLRIHDIKNYA